MIRWLVDTHGLAPYEAMVLCSIAGDFKIAEVVDMPNFVVAMHVPTKVLLQ